MIVGIAFGALVMNTVPISSKMNTVPIKSKMNILFIIFRETWESTSGTLPA